MPGAEVENLVIMRQIKRFVKKNKNAYFFKSLGQEVYFSVLNIVDLMLGNSSSGLLEMPSLKKATINLGQRQSGRLMAKSVINTKIKKSFIIKAIKKIYEPSFQKILNSCKSPYGNSGASIKISKILKKTNLKNLIKKKFYDL